MQCTLKTKVKGEKQIFKFNLITSLACIPFICDKYAHIHMWSLLSHAREWIWSEEEKTLCRESIIISRRHFVFDRVLHRYIKKNCGFFRNSTWNAGLYFKNYFYFRRRIFISYHIFFKIIITYSLYTFLSKYIACKSNLFQNFYFAIYDTLIINLWLIAN